MSQVLGLAWYRFRATFSRRWRNDLALVLLMGLVGGVALGSIAAARRTASSFSVYAADGAAGAHAATHRRVRHRAARKEILHN